MPLRSLPPIPTQESLKHDLTLAKLDNLDNALTAIAASLGLSLSFPNSPTDEPSDGDPSSSISAEQNPTFSKLEKLERTVAGIASALSSINIMTDTSQPPVYKEVEPSELVRIRNKIDCITYKKGLVRHIESLQVQEEKEWEAFVSKEHAYRAYGNSDSLYRKHIRARIEAAKRTVMEYQVKKIKGELKYNGIPDFMIRCLRSQEFEGFKRADGSINNYQATYANQMGCLIAKLLQKESTEEKRLLQQKTTDQ
ncbi:hypothetical protein BGX26_003662 [Mortierella sp. AD094]|nr:hypothetical protein BGX26_003662 [Mortierella sp. AD094]